MATIDHAAVLAALRALAQTVQACTTGSTTLAATTTGYTRAAGSFIVDGFKVGAEVTPSGAWTQLTPGVISALTATSMTILGGRTPAQTAAIGRTLSCVFPALFAAENVQLEPLAMRWRAEEEYVRATSNVLTSPRATGLKVHTGLYVLRFYAPENTTSDGLRKMQSALDALFDPGRPITLATGELRVRPNVGPYDASLLKSSPGWMCMTYTVPWQLTI